DPEPSIELVQRRRAEPSIGRCPHGRTCLPNAIHERDTWAERSCRLIAQPVERFGTPAIAACTGRKRQAVAQLERRADEGGAQALVAAGFTCSNEPAAVESNLIRGAVDEPSLSANEQRAACPRFRPLCRDADDVRRHSIDSIEFLGRPGWFCGDNRKRLIVSLIDHESAGRQKTAGHLAADLAR